MKIEALSRLTTDRRFRAAFWTSETKMTIYIATLKLNSSFGMIAKATGVKMAAKAVGKNSSFRFSVKNNMNMNMRSYSEALLRTFYHFFAFKYMYVSSLQLE